MRIVSCSWNFYSQAIFLQRSLLFHQLFTPSKFLFLCFLYSNQTALYLLNSIGPLMTITMVTILHVSLFCLHSYIWFLVVHVSPLVQFGKFRCFLWISFFQLILDDFLFPSIKRLLPYGHPNFTLAVPTDFDPFPSVSCS